MARIIKQLTWQELLKNNGKLVSLYYYNILYSKCEISVENNEIYFMNNIRSNNDCHRNKTKYKYSLLCSDFTYFKNNFKDVKFLNQTTIYELW
jgi:hypothetical protein